MKYSKKHPLWAVYIFQKQILRRGGKINRYSDLLAFYERKSLVPLQDPTQILATLCRDNSNCKALFDYEFVVYRKNCVQRFTNSVKWEILRVDMLQKLPHGFLTNPGDEFSKLDEVFQECILKDNELLIRSSSGLDVIISFKIKYLSIIRLLKNGYNPDKIIMKKNYNLLPAIILAAGLIIASFIYAYSQRYEIENTVRRVDKWTGEIYRMKIENEK